MASERPSRPSTVLVASITSSSGTCSESLLPPTKLYLARPVQRAEGAGSPAGNRGAKSKLDVMGAFLVVFLLSRPASRASLFLLPPSVRQGPYFLPTVRVGRPWLMKA